MGDDLVECIGKNVITWEMIYWNEQVNSHNMGDDLVEFKRKIS